VPEASGARAQRHPGAVLRAFASSFPRVHPEAWLAPGCVVVGDVEIGAESSVWYGAVVRGDVHRIRVGARTNLQDHCVLHVTAGRYATEVGDEVTVGHRAVVHGCTVGDGALVGIGAIVLDGAFVGEGALVAAGALVAPGARIGSGMLAVGVPARERRPLEESERREQRERTLAYVETARRHAEVPDP
jgi:carbonic anhydrase/acetyltransferase-like protein (isoleucine patch superfamily)